jgi:hypothetical protein
MVLKRAFFVSLIVPLTLAPFAEAARSGKGYQRISLSSKETLEALRFETAGGTKKFDILASLEVLPDASVSFGPEQETFIREWFSKQQKLGELPAALITREASSTLSLRRDGVLPEDLRQRVQSLPVGLECQLPTLPKDLHRVVLLGDVMILEESTARIVDLIRGVL